MPSERGKRARPTSPSNAKRGASARTNGRKASPTTGNQTSPSATLDERMHRAALFDALVGATGQLVWTTTPQGETHDDSPGWRAFTGQSERAFLGSGWRDAIHPDDRERILHLCDGILGSDHSTYETECRLRHADGHFRTAHVRCVVMRGEDGRARELLYVATDITERMRGNQERLRLLAFMDAITTSLGEGIYSVGLDGHLTFMNPAAERLLGWSETELLGKDMHAITHYVEGGAGPDLASCRMVEAMRAGETYRGDEMFVRRDGKLAPVSVVSTPIFSAGRVSGGVVAFNDNTERYQLEEELRIAAQAAANRASEHEAVFEALGDGIVVYDREGRPIHANSTARAARLAYTDRADFDSLSHEERMRQVTILDDQGNALTPDRDPLRRALNGENLTGTRSLDVSIRGRGPGDLWLQMSAAPMRDERGNITGAVVIYRSISERLRLEREVAERARELETVLGAMAEGVTAYRADATIAYMNPAGKRLFGLDTDPDFFGRPLSERGIPLNVRDLDGRPLPPDQWPWIRILRGEDLTGSRAVDVLMLNLRGEERIISHSGAPIRDADGAITGALMVYRDVTEQRRLVREVNARAHLLDTVFEAMTDGVVVHALDGSFLRNNSASRAMAGISDDQHFQNMRELGGLIQLGDANGNPLPLDEWPLARLLHGERLASNAAPDLTLRRPDDSVIHVNITGAPIRDSDGALIGAVSVMRDVTERLRLEQRTHNTLEVLLKLAETIVHPPSREDAAAGQRLRDIARPLVELARQAIGCDQAGVMTLDRDAGSFDMVALVSRTPEMARFWEEELRRAPARDYFKPGDFERFLSGEVVVVRTDAPRYKVRYPDVAPTILSAPLYSQGEVIGLVGFAYLREHDTFKPEEIAIARAVARLSGLAIEREQLQHERAEARASELAQRELVRRQNEFLSVASHELKTPLTSIKANLQLALAFLSGDATTPLPGDATDASMAALQRADRQMLRIERLVGEVLDLSRIQVSRMAIRRAETDLCAIVRDAIEEQAQSWPLRALRLSLPDQPIILDIDGDRIGQVLSNFLTNALKYSPESAPVETTVRLHDGQVWVGVRDHGSGLPPEERERVWERFHRAPGIEVQSGSDVGLGIGLYISRTIVEAHGGQVGVESVQGEGSTFWYTLPTKEEPHAETP